MTTLHLLALADYFYVLCEYIAMRHREICAESDARIGVELWRNKDTRYIAMNIYWNRGTK